MSALITTERASHWYRSVGISGWEPYYEVPRADGKGMRPCTLADARKISGVVPSVTKILGVVAKPQLEAWKIEQGILSALTLPRLANEADDIFARRVVEDAEAQSAKAREFGTAIHDACESIARHQDADVPPELLPYVEDFRKWYQQNVKMVVAIEKVVGNEAVGYAGKLDLHVILTDEREAIIDIKTQGVKSNGKGKKPAFYNDWCRQLAAYGHCFELETALLNIVIDSGEPGPVYVKEWTAAEALTGWEGFQLCHQLWCIENSWYPAAFVGLDLANGKDQTVQSKVTA